MTQMHEEETFQKLVTLLTSVAPDNWSLLQSIYIFHDGAMKLKTYYVENEGGDWKPFNTSPSSFDVMDWWEAYHGMVKETEGNEFKAAKAIIDSNGNLKMKLSYEVIDPLAGKDLLKATENL